MKPEADKAATSATMATPPGQRTPTREEKFLSKLMVKEFNRDRKRQWEIFCNGFKAYVEDQGHEELGHGQKDDCHCASCSKKADKGYFRRKERSRAKAKKALEKKVKLVQQDLPMTAEQKHIGMLQAVNDHLEKKQEKMEEVLRSATKALQHVTATMLELVAEADEFHEASE